jgi:hypothetical protein
MNHPENLALEKSLFEAVKAEIEASGGQINLTKLALRLSGQWKFASARLGVPKFSDFLKAHNNVFRIDEGSAGVGSKVVRLVRARTEGSAVNSIENDLYRPLDDNDGITAARLHVISTLKKSAHKYTSANPALLGEEISSQMFSGAFNKCVRMTISLGHVLNVEEVTVSLIRDRLLFSMKELPESCRLFIATRDTGYTFLETTVTITGPDEYCKDIKSLLCEALTNGRIRLFNKTLSLFHVGYTPVFEAVTETVKDLLARRQLTIREDQEGDENSDADPDSPLDEDSPRSGIVTTPREPLPPAASMWPTEYTFEDLSKCVCDMSSSSKLKDFIEKATRTMAEKEVALREQCSALRDQPFAITNRYAHSNFCEWIAKPEFCLGKGSEATIYMGLYTDPSLPGGNSVLVAIKQNDGTNPFNSQEEKHLMNLKRSHGIAQYHTSFELDYGLMTLFIIAQDIGLISLKDLITVNGVELSAEEKYKLTKALCMGVNHLHNECSVVHRDLRPENVLLMRDGKVCITDFGLSRHARVEGTVRNTLAPRTVMQPVEVQERYGMANDAVIPITHSGDVFMLGCVLAYIHQGRDPFISSRDILEKSDPYLDEKMKVEQPWLFHLLRSMLHHDSEKRPSITYILKHPYFNGHTANFDACLIRGIEFGVVTDYKPKDDHAFRALESVLLSLEQQMQADDVKWYQKIDPDVFKLMKLPFGGPLGSTTMPLAFVADENVPYRDFPLPQLAQLLRWHRNVINHFTVEVQDCLRRSKGVLEGNNSSYYQTGGEFFSVHPAVSWLLPSIWTVTYQNIAKIELARVKLIKDNERRIEEFQTALQALKDQRVVTARVLEWNK